MNKILRLLRNLARNEKGITGIETGIILVSSVAVAGTLATAVIQSGVNSTNDLEKTYNDALKNIRGTFVQKGAVIGQAATTGPHGTVSQLSFTVSLITSGGSMDFTPPSPSAGNTGLAGDTSNNLIVISYTDEYQHVENLYWTVTRLGRGNGDYILEDNEQFLITVGGSPVPGQNGGNLVDALATDLSADTDFTIEVKAPTGATLKIERETPAFIDHVINFQY